jgi:preprotein translocase subunit Sss1
MKTFFNKIKTIFNDVRAEGFLWWNACGYAIWFYWVMLPAWELWGRLPTIADKDTAAYIWTFLIILVTNIVPLMMYSEWWPHKWFWDEKFVHTSFLKYYYDPETFLPAVFLDFLRRCVFPLYILYASYSVIYTASVCLPDLWANLFLYRYETQWIVTGMVFLLITTIPFIIHTKDQLQWLIDFFRKFFIFTVKYTLLNQYLRTVIRFFAVRIHAFIEVRSRHLVHFSRTWRHQRLPQHFARLLFVGPFVPFWLLGHLVRPISRVYRAYKKPYWEEERKKQLEEEQMYAERLATLRAPLWAAYDAELEEKARLKAEKEVREDAAFEVRRLIRRKFRRDWRIAYKTGQLMPSATAFQHLDAWWFMKCLDAITTKGYLKFSINTLPSQHLGK